MQPVVSTSAVLDALAGRDGPAKRTFNDVPLAPSPPEDLYFSEERKAWIASRYRDVLAAFRSTDLSQTGPPTTGACEFCVLMAHIMR